MDKPRVFIGSSAEEIKIVEAIEENLKFDCHCDGWHQGIFEPSTTALESLVLKLGEYDFAIFVFNANDITKIRGSEYNTIRDNVIFETGLFIGKLGREKVFYIAPNDVDVHLPTDLFGFVPERYDETHPNIIASVGSACSTIKRRIKELYSSK